MYNVAVCDDEEVLCNQFEQILSSYITEKKINLEVFYSGEKLIKALSEGENFDLIFLDIELKNINGVEVGKYIREELDNEDLQIVYISAKQQYAMELFVIRPMNFLVKPISKESVIIALEKAMKLDGIHKRCFELKRGVEVLRIPYGDIEYFESDGRKIIVHTGDKIYDMYERLNNIEAMIPNTFIRIHQSYIVNTSKIKRWKASEVYITESTILPISRNYRKQVCSYLLRKEEE